MNDSSQIFSDAVVVVVSIASDESGDASTAGCNTDLQSLLQTSATHVISSLLQAIAGGKNDNLDSASSNISSNLDRWPIFSRRLLPYCEAHVSGGGTLTVSIELADQMQIRQLNRQYRQRDKATNVLSFPALQDNYTDEHWNEAGEIELAQQIALLSGRNPAESDSSGAGELPVGDIVLCASVVEAEVRVQEKTTDAHWVHMVVHGVLHLFGFDHLNDDAAGCMEAIETQLMHDLGYPAPYA